MKLKAWTLILAGTIAGIVNAIILSGITAVSGQTVEVYNSVGKQDDKNWKDPAKQIFICDRWHGRWLTIGRVNTMTNDGGFDASMTYVIVKCKPIVKKIKDNFYEITFTSELTKDLP